ncbi:MAG: hypothetical protein WD342_12165 [Verrucomicrobiales bacterium]
MRNTLDPSFLAVMIRFPILCLLALGPGLVPAEEPFRPNLGPDLPRITVRCGEVTLILRQLSQWTPGRIDYRGEPMTTEGSAYGTVFSFPGVGFIGTGHLENEPEPLESLTFVLDGETIASPGETLAGETFRFERVSRVRNFALKGVIELKDDRLYETATVSTDEAAPLKLVYHFMHAWRPTVSAFLAASDDAPEESIGGELRDTDDVARQFYIRRRVDWVAVYEPESGQFAVSRLLETPELGGHESMIWNVPGTYRKYYLKSFEGDTIPAGFEGTWRMVTGFGAAEPKQWEEGARRLAKALREAK